MPTSNNTSSPVKRPGLGRRAISSHAVVTRGTPSILGDPSDLHTASNTAHNQRAHHHRPHRAHVVGGAHRTHARNPSFGKNLNKLQRFTSAHTGTEGNARHHQRKKSAPPTPVASPGGGNHVHWDGIFNDDDGRSHTAASMKRNNSSPALRRNNSSVLAKKALVNDRPKTSSGKKKTVGFELGDSDNEWEDTTQSPESTRRSSVAQGKDSSAENSTVLVDPLTFVKRSFPQVPRAASLPEPTSFPRDGDLPPSEEAKQRTEEQQEPNKEPEHSDIAARLLSPSHSGKAPPAMSSISATGKPTVVDGISRNASLSNLAASQNSPRRTPSSSTTLANTPGGQTNATSSSMEGGVSRFIVNNKSGIHASSRTDSDPNTPSSFLPHYHPQTPPSPNATLAAGKSRTSPSSRPPGSEPPSRTQQKLWLQRTAALNTSPPDPHGSTGVSPSAMDPTFMAAANSRPGQYDAGRSLIMNGGPRAGVAVHGSEAKHIRKAYEKTALELTVVQRFQTPTGQSFARLSNILNGLKGQTQPDSQSRPSLGKPVKSAPALNHLRDGQLSRDQTSSPEPKQLMGRRMSGPKTGNPQAYLHAPDNQDPNALTDSPNDLPYRFKSQPRANRMLSTSEETSHTHVTDEDIDDTYYPSETDMMIRRMWDSREVATSE